MNNTEGIPGFKKDPRKPGQCVTKSSSKPSIQIYLAGLRDHIQYMKDHALIGKFVGIWTS